MGQVRTIHRSGSRFYVDPETCVKLPGVTSVISMLPKPFLAFWNAKMVAELAVDSLGFVREMSETAGREAAVDYLKGAARRYTKARADVGSNVHDMVERMIRGEYVGHVHPDLEGYKANFAEFLEAVNPELVRAEDIAWSETHGYAGSFDAILRIWLDADGKPTPDRSGSPHLVVTDWKTSKATYPDVALQLSAYARADFIVDSEGNREPMPAFDGGAVLHLTPDKWEFKPVRIDDDVFSFFLALRRLFEWDKDASKSVLGRAIAKNSGKLVTGTQRRA